MEGQFALKRNLIQLPTFTAFTKGVRGQKMLSIFNQGFIKLHKSGQLKELPCKHLGPAKAEATYPFNNPQQPALQQ